MRYADTIRSKASNALSLHACRHTQQQSIPLPHVWGVGKQPTPAGGALQRTPPPQTCPGAGRGRCNPHGPAPRVHPRRCCYSQVITYLPQHLGTLTENPKTTVWACELCQTSCRILMLVAGEVSSSLAGRRFCECCVCGPCLAGCPVYWLQGSVNGSLPEVHT